MSFAQRTKTEHNKTAHSILDGRMLYFIIHTISMSVLRKIYTQIWSWIIIDGESVFIIKYSWRLCIAYSFCHCCCVLDFGIFSLLSLSRSPSSQPPTFSYTHTQINSKRLLFLILYPIIIGACVCESVFLSWLALDVVLMDCSVWFVCVCANQKMFWNEDAELQLIKFNFRLNKLLKWSYKFNSA